LGDQQGLTVAAPAQARALAPSAAHRAIYWRLSRDVTACLAADRILFLDLACDRYRALPLGLTQAFLSWVQCPGRPPPRSCSSILAELRFDARAARRAGFPQAQEIARPSPIDSARLPRVAVGARDLLSVGRAVVCAAREVRSRPLVVSLERRFRLRQARRETHRELKSRLALFRSARPLVPARRVCLHDCLALIDWLGPASAGIDLVFGVSAYPFTAHCLETCAAAFSRERPGHARWPPGPRDSCTRLALQVEVLTPRRRISGAA
jgi:hypothetical protein